MQEAVATMIEGIERGAAQVYVPQWFADIASGKAADVEGFLAGTAEYVRTHLSLTRPRGSAALEARRARH